MSVKTIKASSEFLETHQAISSINATFLAFVEANPELLVYPNLEELRLPSIFDDFPYTLQPWPLFVDKKTSAHLADKVFGLTELVRKIPEKIFKNDVDAIAEFYGIGSSSMLALLLEPPNGIAGCLSRWDLVFTERGFQCLEGNISSRLGGWQIHFWEKFFQASPPIQRFCMDAGIQLERTHPFRALIIHMIQDVLLQGFAEAGDLNLAVVAPAEILAWAGPFFSDLYQEVLQEMDLGLTGEGFCCAYPNGVSVKGNRVYIGERRIHGMVEYTPDKTPQSIYRCFKAGTVSLYNGPVETLLSDKRNLALLSMHADSSSFSEGEKALIDQLIPWTRLLKSGEAFRDEGVLNMPEGILADKDSYVIKKGWGFGGDNVHVGKFTAPDRWRRALDKALSEGDWVVQAYVESRPFMLQHGREGWAEQDVIWGIFCFGQLYGGGFLRTAPKGSESGIVNAAQGAREGLFFRA